VFVLLDLGVSMSLPAWRPSAGPDRELPGPVTWYEFADAMQAGHLGPDVAADGRRRWQRFLDRHLHAGRDPRHGRTDFPPRKLRDLAALPAPLGPVVIAPG
jgi:hypothetical protein